MRVLVSGATGYLGSAVVAELLGVGHRVVGLARSSRSAEVLEWMGAEVHRGGLDDPASLYFGAVDADAVIHLPGDAADRDPAADQLAVEVFVSALEGSDRPLVVPATTLALAPGRIASEVSEVSEADAPGPDPRGGVEELVTSAVTCGVRGCVVRLPPVVHGPGEATGVLRSLLDVARRHGVSAHVDDGVHRWPAVHRLDAARLFRLALRTPRSGQVLHAVAEEGVAFRDVAQAIGARLDLPVVPLPAAAAAEHFGPCAPLVTADNPTSSARTRRVTGWEPQWPGVLATIGEPADDQHLEVRR